jgi:hypothetical protein
MCMYFRKLPTANKTVDSNNLKHKKSLCASVAVIPAFGVLCDTVDAYCIKEPPTLQAVSPVCIYI